jgi:O-antigen ligase
MSVLSWRWRPALVLLIVFVSIGVVVSPVGAAGTVAAAVGLATGTCLLRKSGAQGIWRTLPVMLLLGIFVTTINAPDRSAVVTVAGGMSALGPIELVKLVLLLLPLLVLYVASRRTVKLVIAGMTPLLYLALYGVVSSGFSAEPAQSVVRASTFFVMILSLCAVTTGFSKDPSRTLVSAACSGLTLGLLGLVWFFVIAGLIGIEHVWIDVTTGPNTFRRLGGSMMHRNALGSVAALALLLLSFNPPQRLLGGRSLVRFACMLASAHVLIAAGSRGAIISLVLALVFLWLYWGVSNRSNLPMATVFLCVASTCILLLVSFNNSSFEFDRLLADISRSGSSAEIYSLSGRLNVWRSILGQHPAGLVLGNGYGTISSTGVYSAGTFVTFSAHNGYYQLLSGVGVLGLTLFLTYIVRYFLAFRYAAATLPKDSTSYRDLFALFAVTVYVLVNNSVESTIGVQVFPTTIVLFLSTAVTLLHAQSPAIEISTRP